MDLIINKNRLKEQHISTEEYLALLFVYKNLSLKTLLQRFLDSGQVTKNPITKSYHINDINIIKTIQDVTNTKIVTFVDKEETIKLAKDLINMYPKGIKPNTNKSWRCSVFELTKRLTTLQDKYLHELLDYDKVREACKKYIESFNGDLTTMRTLPFFIYKNEEKGGENEFKSDLLTYIAYIEDGEVPQQNSNWVADLK